MGVRRLYAVVLCACWIFSLTSSVSSIVFKAGSHLSALRSSLFKKGGHERSFGLSVRKVYGKLAIHSKSGVVVHLSVGSDGLLTQKLKGKPADHLPDDKYAEEVDGIFGFYKLPAGYFAALIKRSEPLVGTSLPDIRRVTNIKLVKVPSSVPVSYRNFNATELELEQARAETLLLRTIKQHTFYFSTGSYDISKTSQNNAQASALRNETEPEAKFFWNRNALAPLVENNCTAFVTPVVNAWIGSTNISYEGSNYVLTLISRRSWRRQGPRYIKRGSDDSGDVANYVETEQIVQRADGQATSSFVQVRGSIPLYWTQPADWKLRPPVLTVPSTQPLQHARALKTHLVDMVGSYFSPLWGKRRDAPSNRASPDEEGVLHKHKQQQADRAAHSIMMINLIDKKGVQGKLGQLWHQVLGIVHAAPVPVLPRIGAHLLDRTRPAAYKIGSTSGGDVSGAEKAAATAKAPAEPAVDRNATDFVNGMLNVTVEDLLHLHPEHDATTSSHEEVVNLRQQPDQGVSAVATQWIWFDYHHKCHDGPAAVLELYPRLQSAIRTDDLFLQTSGNSGGGAEGSSTPSAATSSAVNKRTSNKHVISTQKHIIRTNCMDCLDRTNVMQSVVSRWVLMRQIVALRAAAPTTAEGDGARLLRVNNYKSLELPDQKMESEFRRLWTENGDHLSVMYAGSRAMKRDVTQNGVRTQRGAVDDAMSAAQRFFGNNLRDQHKQRGIDLLLGLADYETLSHTAHIGGDTAPAEGDGQQRPVGVTSVGSGGGGGGDIISGGSTSTAEEDSTDESISSVASQGETRRSVSHKNRPPPPTAALETTPTEASAVQDCEEVIKVKGASEVDAVAPVDPALRSSEQKIDAVLTDLLKEVSALQSSVKAKALGARKIKTKEVAKSEAASEVYFVEKQSKNVSPQRVIEQTQYRRSSAEKRLQPTRPNKSRNYVTNLRKIVLGLAPIMIFLKYFFRK